jgi:hypothetical protein
LREIFKNQIKIGLLGGRMVEYLGKYYSYKDVERLMYVLENEGYKCEDVGGSSPDFKDSTTIEGEGKWFTYIRCRGAECSVHEYLCLKDGESAMVRHVGYDYRQDSSGGYYSWDETLLYENDGSITSRKISGGYDYHPNTNRLEKIPATLYYL